MAQLEERVSAVIADITALGLDLENSKWGKLSREQFIFQLEKATNLLIKIHAELSALNANLRALLEKNTPDISAYLENLKKHIVVLQSNLQMEKSKKIRVELMNSTENNDVPELYTALQNKIIEYNINARYAAEKIKNFVNTRNTPFVKRGSTAKNLLEILEKKEDELSELRKKHSELKRKSFLGTVEERSLAEIEEKLNENDKKLSISIEQANESLKTHFAQINYVEGSFASLKEKVARIESAHTLFAKQAIELIRELKKERDYARRIALEIEQDTISSRGAYTRELLDLENKKVEVREKMSSKYMGEIKRLNREVEEKSLSLTNIVKLVSQQEEEIKKLKSKLKEKN